MAAAPEPTTAATRPPTAYDLLELAQSMLATSAPSMWREHGEARDAWAEHFAGRWRCARWTARRRFSRAAREQRSPVRSCSLCSGHSASW